MLEYYDPYLWFEDLESPKVLDWISSENKRLREWLGDLPLKLESRITKYYTIPSINHLVLTDKGYFLLLREKDSFKIKLLTRDGEYVDLIDSRDLGEEIVLKMIYASRSGERLAFSFSKAGADVGVLRVVDVDSMEILDELRDSVFNVVWLNEDKFYYARFYRREKTPDGVEPPAERIFLREDGSDVMVFGEGLPTSYFISLSPSTDYSHALLTVSYGWTRSSVYGGLLDKPESWSKVYGDGDFISRPIDFVDDSYLILSYEDRGFGKILSISGDGEKRVIVDEDVFPLRSVVVLGDNLVANYLVNASSILRIFKLDGDFISEFKFDKPGSISFLQSTGREVAFIYTSFFTPYRLYQLRGLKLSVLDSKEVEGDFIVDEAWATSRDGTRIHMFIVGRGDVKPSKVLIYGYGGFGIALTPRFFPDVIPFLEDGGTFVMTNLRGGSEFGEEWHRAGMRENKQNVFDDFIACINYFKNLGSKIVAIGRSNGGLLVSAVLIQRPDLLDGAVIGYPVIDMMRFHKLYIGKAWIPEYGDPDNPRDREFLMKYSPYHNVRAVKYPPTLIFTGLYDDRVHPAHAFKFAAKLKEVGAPVLVRTETVSGHAGATPKVKIRELAEIMAFIYKVLGISI